MLGLFKKGKLTIVAKGRVEKMRSNLVGWPDHEAP